MIAAVFLILLALLQTADRSVQSIQIVLLKKHALPAVVKILVLVFVGLMQNVGLETTSQFVFVILDILETHSVNVTSRQVR